MRIRLGVKGRLKYDSQFDLNLVKYYEKRNIIIILAFILFLKFPLNCIPVSGSSQIVWCGNDYEIRQINNKKPITCEKRISETGAEHCLHIAYRDYGISYDKFKPSYFRVQRHTSRRVLRLPWREPFYRSSGLQWKPCQVYEANI